MRGLMQGTPLMISSLIDYAAQYHGDTEIVSRTIEGPIHRSNYREVQRRAKQIANGLLALGVKLGDRTYKNHLDGYNQLDLLECRGPSARHELFYFSGAQLGAVRIDDFKFQFLQQPWGWPGEKVTTDMPTITNIRQDPFERTSSLRGESTNTGSFSYGNDFYAREFWRFVVVQKVIAKAAASAIDYPPMQDPASFNLEAVKRQIQQMIKAHEGQ